MVDLKVGDQVNHPDHYQSESGLEAIDVIEAFKLSFCRGNAIKYLLRAGRKGDRLSDLRKARWYIDREIGRLEPPQRVYPDEPAKPDGYAKGRKR